MAFSFRGGICGSLYEDLDEGSGCSLNVGLVIAGEDIY